VGGVDFEDLETGGDCALRGGSEGVDHLFDAGGVERFGGGAGFVEGEGAGRPDGPPAALLGRERRAAAPRDVATCLAAGVRELDRGNGALRGNEAGERAPTSRRTLSISASARANKSRAIMLSTASGNSRSFSSSALVAL
jgi:hypothetical protein